MKKSSGWSSSTYLNFSSGNFCSHKQRKGGSWKEVMKSRFKGDAMTLLILQRYLLCWFFWHFSIMKEGKWNFLENVNVFKSSYTVCHSVMCIMPHDVAWLFKKSIQSSWEGSIFSQRTIVGPPTPTPPWNCLQPHFMWPAERHLCLMGGGAAQQVGRSGLSICIHSSSGTVVCRRM